MKEGNNGTSAAPVEPVPEANGYVETLPAQESPAAKSFQVVEISAEKAEIPAEAKPKRVVRRRVSAPRKTSEKAAAEG